MVDYCASSRDKTQSLGVLYKPSVADTQLAAQASLDAHKLEQNHCSGLRASRDAVKREFIKSLSTKHDCDLIHRPFTGTETKTNAACRVTYYTEPKNKLIECGTRIMQTAG